MDQRFSVLIPTRGDAPHLRAALGSALAQPEAAEVLVIHNREPGAPPLPAGLAGGQPRVRMVDGPGRGPGAARNAGLRLAAHEFIAFLDDDDAFLPGHLAAAHGALAAHPDAGLVAADALTFVDPSGDAPLPDPASLRPWRNEGNERVVSYRELLLENPVLTSVAVIARGRIPFSVRFDESLPTMEDWDLWLRIARERTVVLLPEATALIRRRAGSASRARRQMAECGLAVLERALRAAPEGQRLSARERRLRRAGLHDDLAYACLAEGDAPAARRAALRAWLLRPLRVRSLAYAAASFAPGRARSVIERRAATGGPVMSRRS